MLLSSILRTHLCQMKTLQHVDVPAEGYMSIDSIEQLVATLTPRLGGYAAADITLLVTDALRLYIDESSEGNNSSIKLIDTSLLKKCFENAYLGIIPSCLRSNIITVQNVTPYLYINIIYKFFINYL